MTAGKYNDGARANRPVLAARIEAAMAEAWAATPSASRSSRRRSGPALGFEPRTGPGHTPADLEARTGQRRRPRSTSALRRCGLSWQEADEGAAGRSTCPSSSSDRPSSPCCRARPTSSTSSSPRAFGPTPSSWPSATANPATGYIPTALQIAEDDENLGDWYWVSETAEGVLMAGLEAALAREGPVIGAGA